jgi:hypothetical protein
MAETESGSIWNAMVEAASDGKVLPPFYLHNQQIRTGDGSDAD